MGTVESNFDQSFTTAHSNSSESVDESDTNVDDLIWLLFDTALFMLGFDSGGLIQFAAVVCIDDFSSF